MLIRESIFTRKDRCVIQHNGLTFPVGFMQDDNDFCDAASDIPRPCPPSWMVMNERLDILVLGGGVAGLAVAYFLKQQGRSPMVFEAGSTPGGNCRTVQWGEFRFDTGAHRIHDKDPDITRMLTQLMGNRLTRVNAPSRIFDNGRWLSFPLEPLDVLQRMDASFAIKAGLDLMRSLTANARRTDFEGFAVGAYGRAMAERFLLNYSSKLWGLPCNTLSPDIAGERLRRMNLPTLARNMLSKRAAGNIHYEGEFYYPDQGIGGLADALADNIGKENIRLQSKVTGIIHKDWNIEAVEINGQNIIAAGKVVSTLPLAETIGMMRPEPPGDVLDSVKSLKFRHIRLAVFSIRKQSVNTAATMYFPEKKYCFTRIYEPKNRCITMAPATQTSLAVEVPCFDGDWAWQAGRDAFLTRIREHLIDASLARQEDITGGTDERIVKAYPVLEKDYRDRSAVASNYLSRFQNLELSGRNGLFRYLWIHNLLREGKTIAERITGTV